MPQFGNCLSSPIEVHADDCLREPVPLRPPEIRRVLLTGATGFVGQAVLERIMATLPDTRVTVLVRSRDRAPAADRFQALLDQPVFDAMRDRLGTEAVARLLHHRIDYLEGGLHDLPQVPAASLTDVDVVVHAASTVKFDEPLDRAMRTNVGGPQALYTALLDAGANPHVIHVSTAYVNAGRESRAMERPVRHDIDWRAELEQAAQACAPDADEEPGARDRRLRGLGRARAQALGWTDIYTMTKSLGERVAEDLWGGAHRLTVVRPTIIESALEAPYPGWLDGFKVADPLIAAHGKGQITGFPGRPGNVIDLVPVDVVVTAILAAAEHASPPGEPAYLQVGTGVTQPLQLEAMRRHVHEYFERHPWTDRNGTVVRPPVWRFQEPEEIDAWVTRRLRAVDIAARAAAKAPGQRAERARTALAATRRRLQTMRSFIELYQPYTCSPTVYDDRHTRRLLAAHAGGPDVPDLDWHHYLSTVHIPAVARLLDPGDPAPRRSPLPQMHLAGTPTRHVTQAPRPARAAQPQRWRPDRRTA